MKTLEFQYAWLNITAQFENLPKKVPSMYIQNSFCFFFKGGPLNPAKYESGQLLETYAGFRHSQCIKLHHTD